MPTGRPSLYTPELIDTICALVSAGSNFNRICAEEGMPSHTTLHKWLNENPSFAEKYARAREDRADARFDRIDSVIQDMRMGSIDANQARVEIDAIKWQAGKEKPKMYGEKIEHTGQLDLTIGVAETLRAKRLRRTEEPGLLEPGSEG